MVYDVPFLIQPYEDITQQNKRRTWGQILFIIYSTRGLPYITLIRSTCRKTEVTLTHDCCFAHFVGLCIIPGTVFFRKGTNVKVHKQLRLYI